MPTMLYIQVEDSYRETEALSHIKYNLQKRLTFKYVKYRRIDVTLRKQPGADTSIDIEYHDRNSARVEIIVDSVLFRDVNDRESIAALYQIFFQLFRRLWEINDWELHDLEQMEDEIRAEDFQSWLYYGKAVASLNKDKKAAFRCELSPESAEYYLDVTKGKVRSAIHFLKGSPEIMHFFGFFRHHTWNGNDFFILSDFNKEIFFVFDTVSKTFTVEFRPIFNTLEQLENYIKAFTFPCDHKTRRQLLGLPPKAGD